MNYISAIEFIALIFPIVMVIRSFRSILVDAKIKESVLAAGITGMFAVLPLKFLIYPLFQSILAIDLRSFISESKGFWMQAFIYVALVGVIEETAKLVATLTGAGYTDALRSPQAIFGASLAAGIGFSIAESLDYIYFFGFDVLWLRMPISTIGHVLFSGLAGWTAAISLCKRPKADEKAATWGGYAILLTGLVGAATLHGLFNAIALNIQILYAIPIFVTTMSIGTIFLYYATTNTSFLDEGENAY